MEQTRPVSPILIPALVYQIYGIISLVPKNPLCYSKWPIVMQMYSRHGRRHVSSAEGRLAVRSWIRITSRFTSMFEWYFGKSSLPLWGTRNRNFNYGNQERRELFFCLSSVTVAFLVGHVRCNSCVKCHPIFVARFASMNRNHSSLGLGNADVARPYSLNITVTLPYRLIIKISRRRHCPTADAFSLRRANRCFFFSVAGKRSSSVRGSGNDSC